MACSKLNNIPLYRICSAAYPHPNIPNCIDIQVQSMSSLSVICAHLNAIQTALESDVPGCIICEDTIDIIGSLSKWRFSMEFILNHAKKYYQKKYITNGQYPILQLYSNNVSRVSDQLDVFLISQQWFQPKTSMDTNGNRCYYISRPVMARIVQAYSTFSGDWNIPETYTFNQVFFPSYTITIQIPIFYEKQVSIQNAFCQLQLKLPLLFHDKQLLSGDRFLEHANIFLSGFHKQSFSDPSDYILCFLSELFKYTTIWPFRVVHDIKEANILIETVYGTESVVHKKKWDLAIQFSKELYTYPISYYDITIADLSTSLITPLDIFIPIFAFYIHKYGYFDMLMNNSAPLLLIKDIPLQSCFLNIDEAPASPRACILIDKLLDAGMLHSYGAYKNNCPPLQYNIDSVEYKSILSQYRFILCFNSITCPNNIANDFILPLILRRIPIFEGTLSAPLVYFNHRSFCYFGNHENDIDSAQTLFQQITTLQNDLGTYQKIANTIKISKSGNFDKLHMSALQTKIGHYIDRHIACSL